MSEPTDYSLLKAAALTSEELERRVVEEMRALDASGAGMRLELHPAAAFAVVAFVQLALRHPEAAAYESAANVRRFVEYVRAKFEPHAPAIALAIERGNDPQHDTPRAPDGYSQDIPPSAFGGKRPPADELRFYRLIDERIQGRDATTRGLLLLACSHRIPQDLAKIPPSQEYAFCPTCAERAAFTERSRQARENIIPEPEPEPATLFEFLAMRTEPATPEDIQAYLHRRRGDAPPLILTCPYCGNSQIAPSPLAKVDIYICQKCGRTVETT